MGDFNNEHTQRPGSKPVSKTPTLTELLQRYLDEEELDYSDQDADLAGEELLTPDLDAPPGESSREARMGVQRTTTGVVELMRAEGRDDSADLLEDLRLTRNAAAELLNQLRELHKSKTGTYPSIVLSRTRNKRPGK